VPLIIIWAFTCTLKKRNSEIRQYHFMI